MIPRQPPRLPQLGFLYVPPYRLQGISIAGEESVVHVPELDVCFDIGQAPKPVLTAGYVALSHGHMDHSAAIAYYFSQRHFQGMGTGTLFCPPALEKPIHNVMRAWVDIEAQQTPYNLVPLAPEQEVEIKNHHFLRAFATRHTVPSNGYIIIERRNKLREDLLGTPQEKLIELKKTGEQITVVHEIPTICYTGDTMMGDHLMRRDVLDARVLITECTFLDPDHRARARVGQHLHLDDIVELVRRSSADAIVLTHLSRRTHIGDVRKLLADALNKSDRDRVHLLMDSRTNRERYERQQAEAEAALQDER